MSTIKRSAPKRRAKTKERAPANVSERDDNGPLPPSIAGTTALGDQSDAVIRRITHLHFILSGLLDTIRGGFASLIGVSSFQYVTMQALGRLNSDEPWTVRGIARQMRMTDAYVSTEIAGLVEQGLVTKVVNPDDRRVSFLRLTDKGHRALAAITEIQQTVNAALYGHMSRQQAESYVKELEALLIHAEVAADLLDDIAAEHRITTLRAPSRRRRA